MAQIINGTIGHLELLTEMFIQLRNDEKADNEMKDIQVKNKMKEFLESGIYRAFILTEGEAVYGYALVDITKEPIYLKHLFVSNEHRGKGYGTCLIKSLMSELNANAIDIEVYHWNEKAIKFYEGFGFKKRCLSYRYKK